MAISINGIHMHSVGLKAVSATLPMIGIHITAASTTPAGPPLHVTPTFAGTAYPFGFTDSFAPPDGSINGRVAETSITSSASPYVWQDDGAGTDTVTGGTMVMQSSPVANPVIGVIDGSVEFNMPNGFYMEHKYNSTDINATCVIHMELGATVATFESGATSAGAGNPVNGHAFMLVQGPNGYGSNTTDAYASVSVVDLRTAAIRVEVTSTLVTVYANAVAIIRFVPSFDLQLFGSTTVAGSFGVGFWQANPSGSSTADIAFDYANVGAL